MTRFSYVEPRIIAVGKDSMQISINELRSIVEKPNPEPLFAQWMRKISIYVTWILLRTPINANGVTLLFLLSGLAGTVCYATGNHTLSILGAFLYFFYLVLDHSDGEVARARHECSWVGFYFELVSHQLVDGLLFAGICIGALSREPSLWILICGFLSSVTRVIGRNMRLIHFYALLKFNSDCIEVLETLVKELFHSGHDSAPNPPSILRFTLALPINNYFFYCVILPVATVLKLQVWLLPIYGILYSANIARKTFSIWRNNELAS